MLRCSDTGSNVPIEALGDIPGLVLYSIEILDGEVVLLFMQVGDEKMKKKNAYPYS